MTGSIDRLLEQLDEGCPQCGEEPTNAHARTSEVVLVPCGHVIDATTMPRVKPPDAYDDNEAD
jgi:transcription initiation factor TFIIIB Brf1 subunit/transcription initiation factor TFIIB